MSEANLQLAKHAETWEWKEIQGGIKDDKQAAAD
jgi:hypothetical protein